MKRKDNVFTSVPVAHIPRNLFDLSHEVKASFKFGYLYPIFIMETLPGETIRDQATVFLRAAPMLSPVMHRCDVKVDFFFVPERLVCDSWEDFITGGQDGTAAPVLPFITPASINSIGAGVNNSNMGKNTLWDYLGLPILAPPYTANSTQGISARPFRAYQKIWSDWFRDPNQDAEIVLDTELDGNVTSTWLSHGHNQIRRRGWQKDYFTSCLGAAQRGAQVLIPLVGNVDFTYKPASEVWETGGDPLGSTGGLRGYDGVSNYLNTLADGSLQLRNIDTASVTNTSVSINDLSLANAMQRWLENAQRGGYRYTDSMAVQFGARPQDSRVQRAEYIGGGRQPIQIREVLATAQSEEVPVGDMAGHGISVGKTNRFTYRSPEHGWIIGIMSIMPQTAYSQGIHPMWFRSTKFDFSFPLLSNIGEQPVTSKELYYSFLAADDDENNETFGYLPRDSSYKFLNDRIAGDFRDTLKFWHLGRTFTERPVLDSLFLAMIEHPVTGADGEETYRRIFAVQDGTDYFWCQIFHMCTAKRPISYYSVPRLSPS